MSGKLSRHCTCAECGQDFDRGYAISGRRAAKRQYCSRPCATAGRKAKAAAVAATLFWNNVETRDDDECWPWRGYRNQLGYGRVSTVLAKTKQAHRVAYMLAKGPVPDGVFVCHTCDNPRCCNPKHLWLGTCAENTKDMVLKGRGRRAPPRLGEAHHNAKLTAEQVEEIKRGSEPLRQVANRYGVTAAAIYWIRKGKNWRHA